MEIVDSTCHLDGAVLDTNLRGEMVFPLVAALMRRGVLFIFATGYDQGEHPTTILRRPLMREAAGYSEDRGSAFPPAAFADTLKSPSGTNAKCRDVRYTAAIGRRAEVTQTSSN
jgi:hypothetical protein